ncbi:hypothetical protein EVAR_5349_1 [Eumeta japonica]|uniref:Uncharacterized protein n=1 Tax=Eumeta variegata TaxID=151549 RepID=A0A4C1TN98_EUMVA|nr:hypothetical protein EVAR_5349_1 [Eumeta japonica]
MESGVTPKWVAPGAGRLCRPPLAMPLFQETVHPNFEFKPSTPACVLSMSQELPMSVLYNARNSATVNLVKKVSQRRKIGIRGRRKKGRGRQTCTLHHSQAIQSGKLEDFSANLTSSSVQNQISFSSKTTLNHRTAAALRYAFIKTYLSEEPVACQAVFYSRYERFGGYEVWGYHRFAM